MNAIEFRNLPKSFRGMVLKKQAWYEERNEEADRIEKAGINKSGLPESSASF